MAHTEMNDAPTAAMKIEEAHDEVIVTLAPAKSPGSIRATTGAALPASVIWLHGLGADGHDFVPIVRGMTSASCRRTVDRTMRGRAHRPHASTH